MTCSRAEQGFSLLNMAQARRRDPLLADPADLRLPNLIRPPAPHWPAGDRNTLAKEVVLDIEAQRKPPRDARS